MTEHFEKVIRIGVSACLIGEHVRYDGGHKRDRLITEVLARFVTLVPFCPEVELGLGVPRNTMDLILEGDGHRLVVAKTGTDCTQEMNRWATGKVRELKRLDLSGCILKSKSPSCALEDTRVLDTEGYPAGLSPGLFTSILQETHSELPLIDEIALRKPEALFDFLWRVLEFAVQSHPSVATTILRERTSPSDEETER